MDSNTTTTTTTTSTNTTTASVALTNAIRPNEWQTTLAAHPDSISVATFNTLRRGYAFKGKYWVTEEAKTWAYRQSLHKALLPAIGTDIICLQEAEVGTFDEDFGFMEALGYSALKPVCKKGEHEHTKPSMFFKTSKLALKWQNARTRTVVAQLQDIKSGKLFYVINGHLQGGDGNDDQRCFQVRSALTQLQNHVRVSKLKDEDVACFFVGDFNDTLGSPVHTLIQEGKPSDQEIDKYFKAKPFGFQHVFPFKDSHSQVKNRHFTFKWGVKDDALFQGIDFIYYTSNKFEVECVRHPVSEENEVLLKETLGLPNSWNPSDHLPAAALFKFK